MMFKSKIQNPPAKAGSRLELNKMREKSKINSILRLRSGLMVSKVELSKFKCQNTKQKIFCHWVFVLGISFVICALCFVVYIRDGYAQPISSTELINNAKYYDGKTVVYAGEVIGDIMGRGNYAWLNVNDGKSAIGIWINKGFAPDILYTGSYKSKGDWVEVTGIFQRACPQHGGDLDIHAQGLRKISPGRRMQERLNLSERNLAIVLSGILCLIWILILLKRK